MTSGGKNDLLAYDSFEKSVSKASQSTGKLNGKNPYKMEDPEYYSFLYDPYPGHYNTTRDYNNVIKAINFLNSVHIFLLNDTNSYVLFILQQFQKYISLRYYYFTTHAHTYLFLFFKPLLYILTISYHLSLFHINYQQLDQQHHPYLSSYLN